MCQRTELWAIIEQSGYDDLQKSSKRNYPQEKEQTKETANFNRDLQDDIYGTEEKNFLKSDEELSLQDQK